MRKFCPNVFLIGAQRSGTTFLASVLGQHPDICISNPKEPVFFTKNRHKGHQWYADRFEDKNKKALLDASTWYSLAPTHAFPQPRGAAREILEGVPDSISSLAPNAKIIYAIREPASRMHSLYWFLRREHPDFQGYNSFRQAIDADPLFFRSSDYYGQIQNYLEFFKRDQILIVVFERMLKNMSLTVQQCLDFMSVDPISLEPGISEKSRNQSFAYSRLGSKLTQYLGSTERVEQIRRMGHRGGAMLSSLTDRLLVRDVPALSEDDRDYVRQKMHGSCLLLSEWLGDSLPEWQLNEEAGDRGDTG